MRPVCKPIQVWPFHQAPQKYRDLSMHGGDEDWVALIPADFPGGRPFWIDTPHFAPCDVSEHHLPDGSMVCIGAHA